MVQVGELQGGLDEEDGGVVADQVPVALLGVELHGETPDVPFGIGGSPFARHRGEADEHLGLLADL
jgi:hypothetical protein